VINQFSGSLDPEDISKQVTDGLIETFGCTFARIWLVSADRSELKLIASSGLYTRLDGSFARVPMGCFKIGKIAQHCIPFLSNALPEEAWVKDKEWALKNNIQGFAGLPLMADEQSIGVLAIFSVTPMNPGLLEVLQILSLSIAGALSGALKHQAIVSNAVNKHSTYPKPAVPLSEELAAMLGQQKLSMLGKEQTLEAASHKLVIQLAARLADFSSRYCRLVYERNSVVLETMLAAKENSDNLPSERSFEEIAAAAQSLGGTFNIQSDEPQTVIAVNLELPQQRVRVEETQNTQQPTEQAPGSTVAAISPLSEREHEVMALLAQGLRDRDIADQLYISVRTVKFHTKNMLTKLNVNTRIQAVFEATQKGWLGETRDL